MPTASECAKKHKKGSKAYKDCVSYKGKYKKNNGGRKGNGTGKRMSYS